MVNIIEKFESVASMKNKHYYNIGDDIEQYPDDWCYIAYSGRNTGKTYSALKYMYDNHFNFGFVKRTNEDVDILCKADKGILNARINLSPWVPIMRDNPGIRVKTTKVMKGIGAFHLCGPDGDPEGDPIGYVFSLNAISDIKGFNYDADFLIFDEFIPKPWERVNRHEGDQLLDLYKTLDRDRIHRGLPPTKLICLANATQINNPVFSILEIIDLVASLDYMPAFNVEDRGIFIRKVNEKGFQEEEKKHPMYEALKETQWGQMALDGSFAYNDFSLVKDISLKGAQPYAALIYKKKNYYIYHKSGLYYATTSAFNKANVALYDLDRESERTRYWMDIGFALRIAVIEGQMYFKTFTLYDIIFNFRKIFNL